MFEIQQVLSGYDDPRPDEKQDTMVNPFTLNVQKLPIADDKKIEEEEIEFYRESNLQVEPNATKNELLVTEESSVAYSIRID
jgi:hypothetical protein